MGLSAAEQVGRAIASISSNVADIRSDALPEESDQSLNLAPVDKFRMTLIATVTQQNYPDDAFILDHGAYCILDSSTLKLDEGYESSTLVTTYTS